MDETLSVLLDVARAAVGGITHSDRMRALARAFARVRGVRGVATAIVESLAQGPARFVFASGACDGSLVEAARTAARSATSRRALARGHAIALSGRESAVAASAPLPDGRALILVVALDAPAAPRVGELVRFALPDFVRAATTTVLGNLAARTCAGADLAFSLDAAGRVVEVWGPTSGRNLARELTSRLEGAFPPAGARRASSAGARDGLEVHVVGLDRRSGLSALVTCRASSFAATAPSFGGLSAREAEIAHLAVRGCGNREIAAQVGLSVDAVKWHLKRIYRKLGVAGRTELAARTFGSPRVSVAPAVASPAVASPGRPARASRRSASRRLVPKAV